MPRRYWLMKCEPSAYTIDDLARDGRTSWEGVRNYQARNYMRDDMSVGDGVLFYASNADPSGVTGVATIARAGYPDAFATRKGHKYFDPASRSATPIWFMVDLAFVDRFPAVVSLERLKGTKGLERMVVNQKGSRLSVQPVSPAEFEIVVELGRRSPDPALPEAQPTAPRAAKNAGGQMTAATIRPSAPVKRKPSARSRK